MRTRRAKYLVRRSYHLAGVEPRAPRVTLVHALRHTLATRLAEDGATASEIQHILGHESLSTSQVYSDATASEQRAAARANRPTVPFAGSPGRCDRCGPGSVGVDPVRNWADRVNRPVCAWRRVPGQPRRQ